MLTDKDIEKIIEAEKEVFPTKDDLVKLVTLKEFDDRMNELGNNVQDLRTGFDELQTAIDSYAKKADTYFQEMVMLVIKLIGMKNGFILLQRNLESS